MHTRHAPVGAHEVDTQLTPQIRFAPTAPTKPRDASHDDALAGLIAGIFEGKPGWRVGKGVIEDVLAAIGAEVVVILYAEIGFCRWHSNNGGIVGVFFSLAANQGRSKSEHHEEAAGGTSAGD